MAWMSSFNITPFHAHLELCRDTPSLQTLYLCWAKITLDSTLWMWMTKPVLLWLGETCCQMNITERSGKQPVSWDVELPSSVQLLAIPCNAASRQEYGMGCHFLLQLTFLTQELNPGPPHCGQTLYALSHQRSPPDSLKIQLFNQTVLGLKDRMSLCFFQQVALQLYRFHSGNDCFLMPYANSRSPNTCLPRFTAEEAHSWDTMYYPYTWTSLSVLPLFAKTVLSEDFPARNGKHHDSPRKHKFLMKLAVIKNEKMPLCGVLTGLRPQVFKFC